ncbi:hypothetical protein BKA80DRAFT_278719 [Phyllosticta citrichinensis]
MRVTTTWRRAHAGECWAAVLTPHVCVFQKRWLSNWNPEHHRQNSTRSQSLDEAVKTSRRQVMNHRPTCSAPTWSKHGGAKRQFKRRPPLDPPDVAPRRAPPSRRRLPTQNAAQRPRYPWRRRLTTAMTSCTHKLAFTDITCGERLCGEPRPHAHGASCERVREACLFRGGLTHMRRVCKVWKIYRTQ